MTPTIRLLYAEDNPQDADLTKAHFAEFAPEFELLVVGTGAACLEQVQGNPPDLLLLDYRLPDTDGEELLKTLRHLAPGLPVVIVTGVGNEELVVRALGLGAAHYVRKHGNYLEALPNLLRTVLDEHRRQQSQGLATVPQRILYVEHQAMDIDLTLRHFADAAPQFTVEVIQSCAEALARLARPPAYDLALIDLRMADQGGLDLVREAKRRKLSLPPFIIISGAGDEDSAIAAFKLGAADYIVKFEGYLNLLTYRIDHAIDHERLNRLNEALHADVAERIKAEESLRVHQMLALRESDAFGVAILDSVAAEIAVLDADGVIVLVNQPWRRFGLENGSEPGIPAPQLGVGVNYLAVCRASAASASDAVASSIGEGIQAVLERRLPRFTLEYPCDSALDRKSTRLNSSH